MGGANISASRAARLEEERLQRERDLKNKRFALQLWRLVNGGMFAFFILANSLMRQTQTTWPPMGISRLDATIPAIISVGLLISGWTASRVLAAIRRRLMPRRYWDLRSPAPLPQSPAMSANGRLALQ